jgi:hypothetical protein
MPSPQQWRRTFRLNGFCKCLKIIALGVQGDVWASACLSRVHLKPVSIFERIPVSLPSFTIFLEPMSSFCRHLETDVENKEGEEETDSLTREAERIMELRRMA